jgi:glycosyltransferase involved in cell wall biosynthesis
VSFLFLYLIASARPAPSADPAKMLVVVGEAGDFLARRVTLANAAAEAGYAVEVVCEGRSAQRQKLEALGLPLHRWRFQRFSTNPWRTFQAIDALRGIYEAAAPALVHHVGPKPVVFGAIAARLAGVPVVLGTFDGADFPFEGRRDTALARRWLRPLRWAMDRPGARLLAQNPEDAAAAIATRVVSPKRIGVMPGAAVDTEIFQPSAEPEGGPVVVTVATRMLWSKGLRETVAAAKLVRESGVAVVVRLIGDIDPDNPDNVHPATLSLWNADGWVEWTGGRPDMPQVWAETNIAVLASHHEGVPQSLMEAAASGRALIASDVPGCRSLVIDGETGILVPPKDPDALAAAILTLAGDPDRRAAMGAAARARVEAEFAAGVIEARMIALYRELTVTGAA